MAVSSSFAAAARPVFIGVLLVAALSACDPPFGLGLPSTQSVEAGAADALGGAASFEMTGSYSEAGSRSSIDLQLIRPTTQHVVVSGATTKLEAVVIGGDAYFRGQEFLAQHVGADPVSQSLVKSAGGAWWKGAPGMVPKLPDFTDGSTFRGTFLGTAVTQRTDRVSVDGTSAIEMSGPRADVFLAADDAHAPLRVRTRHGVVIDGISEADFRYGNFNRNFGIRAPKDVIDFSNLSRSAPIYTVVSVDSSGCASPCIVRALLKNLGGTAPAKGPSSVTFIVKTAASGNVAGRCSVLVSPDVGYNGTTTVSCTIALTGQQIDAAIVTAVADNPGPP